MNIKTIGVGPRLFNFDNDHSLLVLVKPFLLIGPVLKHPVLLCQQLLQDDWNKKHFIFKTQLFFQDHLLFTLVSGPLNVDSLGWVKY